MKWLLSGGCEPRAKRRALERYLRARRGDFLDLATGTGDVLQWLAENVAFSSLVGADISDEMVRRIPNNVPARLVLADLNALPFRPGTFDVVTAAYALRYTDPEACLRSVFEILRAGGRLVLFDLANPSRRIARQSWYGVLLAVGTVLGLLLHGCPTTYWHLVATMRRHPGHKEIVGLLRTAGFARVRVDLALGGMIAVHVADKEDAG